jgi:hypothetical protein
MPDAPLSSYLTPLAKALRPRWYRICFASSYRMRPCIHVGKYCLLGTMLLLVLRSRSAAQTDQLYPRSTSATRCLRYFAYGFRPRRREKTGALPPRDRSFDFYVKSPLRLTDVTTFDLDDSKFRLLVVSVGYRYLSTLNTAPTNRFEPFFTLNCQLAKLGLLISDRNCADLDWKSGNFTWRCRNRIQVERTLRVVGCHPSAYASAEFYHSRQYSKWSDTAILAGCLFPIGKHIQFNPHYEHQNNAGNSPNEQTSRPDAQPIFCQEISNSARFGGTTKLCETPSRTAVAD